MLLTISALLLPLLTTTLATPLGEPTHSLTFPQGLPRRTENGTLLDPRDQNMGKNAHLTLKFYSAPACGTSVISLWENIDYNDQISGRAASFTMSRDLIDKEVLDFSIGSNIPPTVYGMEDASSANGAQYPGPGYTNGGFHVPSQCDTFFWSMGELAPAKGAGGKYLCYTPPRVFNCARLWMQS